MFITHNQVRMHDTDMAGILYFANQFRFVHDAWEDLIASEGLPFRSVLEKESFLFVIRHVEADYLAALGIGDVLTIHVYVSQIGNSSFTLNYDILRGKECVGKAKTVHVTIEKQTRKKAVIPPHLRVILEKHVTHK